MTHEEFDFIKRIYLRTMGKELVFDDVIAIILDTLGWEASLSRNEILKAIDGKYTDMSEIGDMFWNYIVLVNVQADKGISTLQLIAIVFSMFIVRDAIKADTHLHWGLCLDGMIKSFVLVEKYVAWMDIGIAIELLARVFERDTLMEEAFF